MSDSMPTMSGGPARAPGAPQALVLIALNAMPILANASLVPSLPKFMRHFADTPGAAFLVPMILTLPTLCIGMFSGLAGVIADRWGRRNVILPALALFVVCGMAPLLTEDLRTILIARFFLGIAEACTLTAGNALMGDYFSGEVRRKWLSYEMVLGPFFGSMVLISGGFLGSIWWRAPFALYAVGALVLIAAALVLREPPPRPKPTPVEVRAATGFPWSTAGIVAVGTLCAAIPFFSQNIQHGRIFAALGLDSPFDISLFAMMASVGTMVGAYTFRFLPVRRIEQVLALVFALFAVSFIALSFRPPLILGTVIDAIGQFAGGMCYPAVLAWALSRFPPEFRGRGVGVWSGSFYVGSFVSGLVIATLAQWTTGMLGTIGVIGYACAALSLGLLVAGLWRPAQPSPEAAA